MFVINKIPISVGAKVKILIPKADDEFKPQYTIDRKRAELKTFDDEMIQNHCINKVGTIFQQCAVNKGTFFHLASYSSKPFGSQIFG